MRFSRVLLGGGPRMAFPKRVWTPAGGWYANPKNWKTNAVVIGAGCVAVASWLFSVSAENERRYNVPLRPVPSQRWAKWTSVDDPEYQTKLEEYHKNKMPLWKRIFPTAEDDQE